MNTPISSKTGQPMADVRFSVYDMQGKLLCMAISPYFLHTSPKKTSPAAARRRGAFILIYAKEAGGGRGRSRRGRFGGTGLSLRGGSLQGLSQRHLSPTGGGRRLGKVSRGGGPRGTGLSLRGGSLQGLLYRQTILPVSAGPPACIVFDRRDIQIRTRKSGRFPSFESGGD